MNVLFIFGSALALAGPAQTSPAQTAPSAAPRNPTPSQAQATKNQTAERRADAYKGPKVVKDDKALGQKFIHKSKPADMNMRLPAPVRPLKE
jgi:hypothetical protein